MIKKFTLLLLAMLCIAGTNAKNRITTLWEGTYSGAIGFAKSELVEGATITVYYNLKNASSLGILHTDNNPWTTNYLPSLYEDNSGTGYGVWKWQTSTPSGSYAFTLTAADMAVLSETDKLYIAAGNAADIVPTSITMTEENLTPASTTNISTESYTADWTGKQYKAKAVSGAKIGDVLKFTYTATGTYFQIDVMNYAKDETFENVAYSVTNGETYTYEYVIPDYTTLKKIREEGFSIKGADFQISSVDLLTYSDSYGYVTITIGATGYATWSSDKKYDFKTAGITAYYASNVTTGVVTLTPMDITWDWQGYILKADPDTYDVLESLTTDGTYYPSTNYLKQNVNESSIAASVSGTYHYIFAKDNETSEIGFYKLVDDAHTLAANKAYLETTTDFTPPAPKGLTRGLIRLSFGGGEGTTAINTALKNPIVEDGIYYTLQGVAVKNPSKGIYILNGKKVFVK